MNIVKSSDSEPCGLAVDLMLEMCLEPSRLSHLENLLTESFIRGLSTHTTQYGFSLLSLKLLYRNGLKIWPNKLRSTWMASPKNQKNVLPRISDDIPAWSFLRGDLNLKDPLPFRVIAALTKNTKTQHWPCAAKAAKKKTSARTHTWKDLCFKGKWEEYSSHKTLQLLGSSKPSQNPKNITWPLPKRPKRTTTLNPYLEESLLQV